MQTIVAVTFLCPLFAMSLKSSLFNIIYNYSKRHSHFVAIVKEFNDPMIFVPSIGNTKVKEFV